METVGIVWVLAIGLGLVMSLGAPMLSGVESRPRRVYGGVVAADLVIAGAGLAAISLTRERSADATPYVVGILVVTTSVAALLALAVRAERGREAGGWVPTAVLAALPVFLLYCFAFAEMMGD